MTADGTPLGPPSPLVVDKPVAAAEPAVAAPT